MTLTLYIELVWENTPMLRTIFSIGLFAVLGLIALRFIFGIFGAVMGLFMMLLFLAIKIAIVGLLIYFVIRIVSPDTAQRLRERWSGRAA
jgi:membrane protein implicated in regulation of membrane protease activity